MAKGYRVPSMTASMATTSSTLLDSSSDSREKGAKLPPMPTFGARQV